MWGSGGGGAVLAAVILKRSRAEPVVYWDRAAKSDQTSGGFSTTDAN